MIDELKSFLNAELGTDRIDSVQASGGGCINQCFCLTVSSQQYFLKCNEASISGLFACESRGLEELANVSAIRVPKVYAAGISGSYQFLLCEYIETGRKGKEFFQNFGKELAQLHKNSYSNTYGFVEDNYLGSARQENAELPEWIEFYRLRRLEFQYQWARRQGLLDASTRRLFNTLLTRLDNILISDKAALLHGDLWAGNYMVDNRGAAVLVDPAVYYGHRETDIAMTELFSGFGAEFYKSYSECYPLQPGYSERRDIYHLYHLLNHLNLFGKQYYSSVMNIIRRYGT